MKPAFRESPKSLWLAAIVALSAVGLLEGTARATPTFPPVIESTWDLKPEELAKAVGGGRGRQGCLLCHSDELNTPPKTVTTPVGIWFYQKGLLADQTSKLKTLLGQSQADGQDSDGDGVSDYDELHAGTDPNVKNKPKPPPPVVMDGGVVVDAGPPPVTEPEVPQKLPPLLETGCACFVSRGKADGFGAMFAVATVALLAFARRAGTLLACVRVAFRRPR